MQYGHVLRDAERGPTLNPVIAFTLAWGGYVTIRHLLYWTWTLSESPDATAIIKRSGVPLTLAALEIVGYLAVAAALLMPRAQRQWGVLVGLALTVLATGVAAGSKLPDMVQPANLLPLSRRLWAVWSTMGAMVVPAVGLIFAIRAAARFRP